MLDCCLLLLKHIIHSTSVIHWKGHVIEQMNQKHVSSTAHADETDLSHAISNEPFKNDRVWGWLGLADFISQFGWLSVKSR